MATFLLVVIYIAFIGLGIPDSLFGTAWPVIYREFSAPVSYAGFYSILCFAGTVGSSLFSARIINRFGTAKVTAFSTALTASVILGVSFAGNIWLIFLLAIPLGLGAGAIDTALNNYVALHYSASHMSFLHCFYGVGVTISPYLMSIFLSGADTWRGGYRSAFYIQLAITIICFAAFPLWKRAHKEIVATEGKEEKPKTVPFSELLKMPAARTMGFIFLASVLIETCSGTWAATYLVDYKGMAPDAAAEIVVVYYAGMISGRFLSGVLSNRLSGWRIIKLGQIAIGLGLVLLALPFGPVLGAVGLFLVALGNGPLYPNLTHLAPKVFGRDISQSIMGLLLAAANTGAMIGPPLFGIVARYISVGLLPYYLLLFFLVMCVCVTISSRQLSKE